MAEKQRAEKQTVQRQKKSKISLKNLHSKKIFHVQNPIDGRGKIDNNIVSTAPATTMGIDNELFNNACLG